MRKLVLVLAMAGLLSAALYAGWRWQHEWRFVEKTDNAYVHADISVISPTVPGYVDSVRVADNQLVKAGDVLVTLVDRDYAARVAEAAANVVSEQAAIVGIDSRLMLQLSLIEQAEAAVAGAQAELTRSRRDYERLQALRRDDVVSRQRLETVEADFAKATALMASARAAAAAERQRLDVLQSERVLADAKVAEARAVQTVAEVDLANTVIRAPVDGVVGNRGVQAGHYVRAGTNLLSVVPLPAVYLVANFKETQIGRMRTGQRVRIAIDAFPDTPLEGRIDSVAPASGARFSLLPPENASGNFTKVVQRIPVRIALLPDHPLKGRLRPGLSAVVSVDICDAGIQQEGAGGIFGAIAADPALAEREAPNPASNPGPSPAR
jgi:membrane fusion protein (multidrug efflux system)